MSKRKKTKTKTHKQREHAKKRALERYGLDLNRHAYREAVLAIQKGTAKLLKRQSRRVTIWAVKVQGRMCKVVYDSQRKTIVTFLPFRRKEPPMPTQKEPLTITQLQARNFKGLKAIALQVDGRSLVPIKGRNAMGKSSVLDAIASTLGGKDLVCPKPIRNGEKEACVQVEMGDYTVTRIFTEKAPRGRLEVRTKDGAKYTSPQAFLNEVVGKLSFDPLAFMRMDSKAQSTMLRELLGIDTRDLDVRRATVFEERTLTNREVKKLEARIDSAPAGAEDVPDDEVDMKKILAEIEAANKEAEAKRMAEVELNTMRKSKEQLAAEVACLKEQISSLNIEIMRLGDDIAEKKKEVALMEAPDVAPLKEQLANAESINEAVRSNKARIALAAELEEAKGKASTLTSELEAIDEEKKARLSSVDMPLEGLTLDDEQGVIYNGNPISQASQAEQIRIGVAMGQALNPALKVVLIHNGNDLDDEAMAYLAEQAKVAGLQVWIETIKDENHMGFIIEEGEATEEKYD